MVIALNHSTLNKILFIPIVFIWNIQIFLQAVLGILNKVSTMDIFCLCNMHEINTEMGC